MRAIELMEQCYLAGLEFEDEGERLIVRPRERLTDAFRFQIKAHKATILRILKSDTSRDPCKICGFTGMAHTMTEDGLKSWESMTFDSYCEWCIDLVVAAEAVGDEIVLVKV